MSKSASYFALARTVVAAYPRQCATHARAFYVDTCVCVCVCVCVCRFAANTAKQFGDAAELVAGLGCRS